MRFIPVNCIREGMISGKRLYGKNGELLLNIGSVIRAPYMARLRELGYNGIYIDDDLSKDIEIGEVISDGLRQQAVRTLKNTFIDIQNQKVVSPKKLNDLHNLVGNIIEKILSNRNLMVNMVDLKVFDDYTFYHSVNVGVLSLVIGAAMNFTKNQLYSLGLAAILHDIGKVFITKEILNKSQKLNYEEFEEMKSHSLKGYEYIKQKFEIPPVSYIGILQHHEKPDGTGYPNGLKSDQISLFAKIISVSDVYDALTSDRPYRTALLPSEAVEHIMGGCGSLFDPAIVNTFVSKIAPYPVGTCVMLSNDKVGIVVENFNDCCLRPKIKIVKHGNILVEPYYIDLRNDKSTLHITITGIRDIDMDG